MLIRTKRTRRPFGCRSGAKLLVAVIGVCLAAPVAAQIDRTVMEDSMRLEVAAVRGVDADRLQLGDFEERHFEELGQTVYRAKIVDRITGEISGVTMNGVGDVLSFPDLLAEEGTLARERHGALDARLATMLRDLDEAGTVRVALWLRCGEIATPPRADYSSADRDARRTAQRLTAPSEVENTPEARLEWRRAREQDRRAANDALRRQATEQLAEQMVTIQAPVLAHLERLGLEPSYASPIAPLIYVVAPKSAILELSQSEAIAQIFGPNQNKDELEWAKPSQKGDVVDYYGFDGDTIKVGHVEDSRIEFGNPHLNPGFTRVVGDPNVDNHATGCAGILGSFHFEHQGVAQGVSIYSANGTTYDDDDMAAAIDWAASTQNLDVINNSWGDDVTTTSLNEHDNHLDYIVRYLWSTVTASAGNDAGGCGFDTDIVSSPGKGFNIITVGGYNDHNTVTWDDDDLYGCTSWVDPATGAEKPEVAAAGQGITSTIIEFPWIDPIGSGTSYSAPMVAGLAANIMSADSGLEVLPEAVKAIIMATALHNIEGATHLSEIDGAGAIDMRAAVNLVDDGMWDWRNVDSSDLPYSFDVWCDAGERIRAVAAWDSKPTSDYTSNPLQCDLDITVREPDGTFLLSAVSSSNPFEIAEFTAYETGYYEFEISDWYFLGTLEYVGFAVFTSNKGLIADESRSYDSPPDTDDCFRFDSDAFWNVVAMKPVSADHDLRLKDGSAWEDPDDYDTLAFSLQSGSDMELVLVDRNHASSGSYYTQVSNYSGTGDYEIQHSVRIADVVTGENGPYPMEADDLVKIFDTSIGTTEYFIAVEPEPGAADLALYLFDSVSGDSDTYYQRASDAIVIADDGGPGEPECLSATHSGFGDWHGLVVANVSGAATDFTVYKDSTPPAGSVEINGGLSETGSARVELSITAFDTQTGIKRMRIRNPLGAWTDWMPYVDTVLWDLTPEFSPLVNVEVENHACMRETFTDVISVYDCPQPAGPLVNGNFSDPTGFPWCFEDESTDGFVDYTSGAALVRGPNDGGGEQETITYQRVVVGSSDFEIQFDWSFASLNSPSYDGAVWDLVEVGTGSSVIGGPETLSSTDGESGSVTRVFSGPGTFEIRLGTFSTDSQFGYGTSTYDNVEIFPVDCDGISGLTCTDVAGAAQLTWVSGDSYDTITVEHDGALLAVIPGSATLFLHTAAHVGLNQYEIQGHCSPVNPSPSDTCSVFLDPPGTPFVRGDCNTDGSVQISDVIYGLAALFSGGPPSPCEDACDANDDGGVDISDMIYLLAALFSGGPEPPAPHPTCGLDPTDDALDCSGYVCP